MRRNSCKILQIFYENIWHFLKCFWKQVSDIFSVLSMTIEKVEEILQITNIHTYETLTTCNYLPDLHIFVYNSQFHCMSPKWLPYTPHLKSPIRTVYRERRIWCVGSGKSRLNTYRVKKVQLLSFFVPYFPVLDLTRIYVGFSENKAYYGTEETRNQIVVTHWRQPLSRHFS